MARMLTGDECEDPEISQRLRALSMQRLRAAQGTDASEGDATVISRARLPIQQLKRALDIVDKMHFVGLTNHWQESICLFHAMHGTSPSAVEFVNSRPRGVQPYTKEYLTTTPPLQPDSHNEDSLEGWHDLDDEIVYKWAVARFKRDLRKFTTCSIDSLVEG